MRDTADKIDVKGLLFRGCRETFDEGSRGHIELLDYETGEPIVRVVHPGPELSLEIVEYARPVPRFVVEWLLDRAETYLV